jgi:hypothetical protein
MLTAQVSSCRGGRKTQTYRSHHWRTQGIAGGKKRKALAQTAKEESTVRKALYALLSRPHTGLLRSRTGVSPTRIGLSAGGGGGGGCGKFSLGFFFPSHQGGRWLTCPATLHTSPRTTTADDPMPPVPSDQKEGGERAVEATVKVKFVFRTHHQNCQSGSQTITNLPRFDRGACKARETF